MFGAELVDDFRACTRRIGLLFAANRPMHRAIVAVNWNDRLQIHGRFLVGRFGPPRPPLSLSHFCSIGRTCVSWYAGARDQHSAFLSLHFGDRWSRWSAHSGLIVSSLSRSPGKKSIEKALYRMSYKLCNKHEQSLWRLKKNRFHITLIFLSFIYGAAPFTFESKMTSIIRCNNKLLVRQFLPNLPYFQF